MINKNLLSEIRELHQIVATLNLDIESLTIKNKFLMQKIGHELKEIIV